MQATKRFNTVERKKYLKESQELLWSTEYGLKYLIENRKIEEDIIREFKLGYFPASHDNQLAGRIVFPIFDASSNLIALSSRAIEKPLPDSDFSEFIEDGYSLPDHWHESFEKSFYLYGMDVAKGHTRNRNFAVVVEGPFDVLQMHNHGIKNTVGLFGTKMSQVQLSVILRYCSYIILLLDSDRNLSGQKGADKIIKSADNSNARTKYVEYQEEGFYRKKYAFKYGGVHHEVDPRSKDVISQFFIPDKLEDNYIGRVPLPEGYDPDEYLRQNGNETLKHMIDETFVGLT